MFTTSALSSGLLCDMYNSRERVDRSLIVTLLKTLWYMNNRRRVICTFYLYVTDSINARCRQCCHYVESQLLGLVND